MRHMIALTYASLLITGAAFAQRTTPYVQAVGDGSVAVTPDQARISLSVVTQAQTARDASGQNATVTNNVLLQLKGLLGMLADIKTINYSLTPNYSYAAGQTAQLVGYTASNTVQVTTADLANVGTIIDTGIGAGANQVSSLQFGLKDDSAARAQALKLATAAAKANADAMASGVNMHTGAVQVIQEGVSATPVLTTPGVGATASTPIQSGTVNVSATVTLAVALVP